jgi:hypothetical protein
LQQQKAECRQPSKGRWSLFGRKSRGAISSRRPGLTVSSRLKLPPSMEFGNIRPYVGLPHTENTIAR